MLKIKEKCKVCKRELERNKGFVSEITKEDGSKQIVSVCSQACRREFEKGYPHRGKPLVHMSRVTGYMQVVENWNPGKLQEFKDRKRYKI